MTRFPPIVTTLLVTMLSLTTAMAQTDSSDVDVPVDPAVEPVLSAFNNLYRSLQNAGGVRDESLGAIGILRDRVERELQTRSGDRNLLGMLVQLNVWLDDQDAVNAAFQRLLDSKDANPLAFGEAWVRYFQGKREDERVDEIYETLIKQHPTVTDFRVNWASRLEKRGDLTDALRLLEGANLDPDQFPGAKLTLANCYMVTHQFQRGLSELESIPADKLEEDRSLQVRVDFLRSKLTDYVELWSEEQAIREAERQANDLPRVAVQTDRGRMVVELFENEAPNTVANFVTLAEQGFYDQTTLHSVVQGLFAQGGDPTTREEEDAPSELDYRIKDEKGDDARAHFRGSIGMDKKAGKADSAASQFYFSLRPQPERNEQYTVFGRVIEGLDVLDQLEKNDIIRSMSVIRKRDHDYTPETISDAAPTSQPAIPVPLEPMENAPDGVEIPDP